MSVQTIIIPFDGKLMPEKKLVMGNISCFYENGNLRYLKIGNIEFVRLIYFAVRNEYWATAPYRIENEVIEQRENNVSISYTAVHSLHNISYQTEVNISIKKKSISFAAKGRALNSFKKNRIGICVLHPIKEYIGKNATITQPNGEKYEAKFPELISPYQPFKDIKEMNCVLDNNLNIIFEFEGDIFETEDQRNWSDASYKTYSTPLNIPFPVTINEGDTCSQKLTITIDGSKKKKFDDKQSKTQQSSFPKIGYSRNNIKPLTGKEISLLSQLPFDHYRVELELFKKAWTKHLAEAISEAMQLNTKLDLVLFCSKTFRKEIADFVAFIEKELQNIQSILIFQQKEKTSPPHIIDCLKEKIKQKAPNIKIGYGSNEFFAELNRNRPHESGYDFLSFPLNPQVHANDTITIMENLQNQEDLLQTTLGFSNGCPIQVAPITFENSRVINNNGVVSEPDARLRSGTGAIWTIHTIKNLSRAHSLTFYQTVGTSGIVDGTKSEERQLPLFNLLKEIKRFNPKWILRMEDINHFEEDIVLKNEEGVFLRIQCQMPL